MSGRRRTFCSDACVHEWRLRSSTSYLRECVFERDKGVCALCGLDTHKRAIEAGDSVSGCSVHLVTEELDSGTVLGQAEVAIRPEDNEATLEARVLEAEHELYPRTLAEFVAR